MTAASGLVLSLGAACKGMGVSASAWLVEQGRKIPPMLNRNASLMDDYAGNALYRKSIGDARDASLLRPVAAPNGCFAAGTLVHTKNGLVPIEQVRVGDWVLSQSENKDGSAPACKQVVNTFAFDDKDLMLVRCYKADGTVVEQFAVTGNHPFWVKGIGWTRADQLDNGSELELQDGTRAITFCAAPIMRTAEPGVGWVTGVWGAEANDGSGNFVDLRERSITVVADAAFNWEVLDNESADPHFKTQVFNLEIDEFHTYYVGTLGVWVHNTNCGDTGVALVEACHALPHGHPATPW